MLQSRIVKYECGNLLPVIRYLCSSNTTGLTGSLRRRSHCDANAVIVGGGVVGVSTAYHLAKGGMKDVVLLEKTELTAGSTWHAAGLATYFHPAINPKKIHHYSLELYKQLEDETGQNVSLHTPGSLRLCSTPERMDEAKYQMTRQHWNKAVQTLVSPEEVEKLFPLINMDKILGGIFNPGDGHIDPNSLTQALSIGARRYGAEIYQQTPVTGLEFRSDGYWDVKTTCGTLRAKHIINAAGFWAHEICRMIGVDLPIVPVHHQYVVTRSIPEVAALKKELPVIRDLEGSYYLRQERQGLLFGPYERIERMKTCDDWYLDKVPPDFGKELFVPDLERIMPNVEAAMEMVPVLQSAEIQNIISGPITYNCENAPLLGAAQGLRNFWLMVGFGYGIIQAGGAGRFIASWILDGEPPHELTDLDANRYRGKWCTKDYALKKARETYGLNNLLGYPKEERWAGRPTSRTSCLYDDLKERGAEFGFHTGWEQPHWFARTPEEKDYKPSFRRTNWFSAMRRECETVLNRVGVADLTPFAKIEVEGSQAAEFLDKVTANTLPKLNTTCISHLLTPKGRVFAELTITRLDDNRFMIVTGAGSELHDLAWLEKYAWDWNMDVQFRNNSDNIGVLGVAGPLSRELLQPITETDLSAEKFKFLECKMTTVSGVPATIIRISYTGELGWEIYCDIQNLPKLYKCLHQNGSKWELDDFGSYALNSLRIEKGFRMWGNEMNVDTNPIEAGLGFFIKQKKAADFIGKESIKKILSDGLSRKLVFLKVDTSDVDPEGNETIWLDNKVIGNTTSGTYGSQVGYSLAMAYVPYEYAIDGQSVGVELLGNVRPAEVMLNAPVMIEPMRERLKLKSKQAI